MKKVLIAITGLLLITNLTINAQTQDKKPATEKKMSCCMNKGSMAADTSKCKEMKAESSKNMMKCSDMKEGTKCDPAKCKDVAKK